MFFIIKEMFNIENTDKQKKKKISSKFITEVSAGDVLFYIASNLFFKVI